MDFDEFPTIWDKIISDAEPPALPVLRRVSRQLSFRIDPVHIVISQGSEHSINVESLWGSLPLLQDLVASLVWDTPIALDRRKKALALASRTRVLELRGLIMIPADLRLLVNAFPNLQMVRICNDPKTKTFTPYVPVGARTLVLFSNAMPTSARDDGQDANIKHMWRIGFKPQIVEQREFSTFPRRRQLVAPKDSQRSFPPQYRKVVLNLNGYGTEASSQFHLLGEAISRVVDNIVFVAPRHRSLTRRGCSCSPPGSEAMRWNADFVKMIGAMITPQLIATGIRDIRFTFVGFDDVHPELEQRMKHHLLVTFRQSPVWDVNYDLDDEYTAALGQETIELLRSRARKEADRMLRRGHDMMEHGRHRSLGQRVMEAESCLEFLSREEYVQRVGEEVGTLELLEYRSEADYPDVIDDMVEIDEKNQKEKKLLEKRSRMERRLKLQGLPFLMVEEQLHQYDLRIMQRRR